jgi:hypothetical protein
MCVCSSASLKEGRRQGQIHTVRREAEDTVLRAEGGHRSRTPGWLPANGSDSTRVVEMMPPKSFDKNIAEECCELWLDGPQKLDQQLTSERRSCRTPDRMLFL